MLEAVLSGALAGYGIAIPVGAIAVLIVGVGISRGFPAAASAGAGAATADLLYATVAVVAGSATASLLEGNSRPIRYVSAGVLLIIAVAGLAKARRRPEVASTAAPRGDLGSTYLRFVGLTIINPLTVIYFTTVVVGSGLGTGLSPAEGLAFVLSASLASLSWQLLLAGVGSVARHRLTVRFRLYSAVAGNLVIAGFALRILLQG